MTFRSLVFTTLLSGSVFACADLDPQWADDADLEGQEQAVVVSIPARVEAERFERFRDNDTIHEGNCGTGAVDADSDAAALAVDSAADGATQAATDDGPGAQNGSSITEVSVTEVNDGDPAPELPPPLNRATNHDPGHLERAELRRPTASGTPADH